jgi:hypothetical protein
MPIPPSRSVIHRNTWDSMGSCSAKRPRKLHLQTRDGGGGYGMSTMDIAYLTQSSRSWAASTYISYTCNECVMLTDCSTSGHATRTTPAQGWATPSPLGPYFKNVNWEGPRTATQGPYRNRLLRVNYPDSQHLVNQALAQSQVVP